MQIKEKEQQTLDGKYGNHTSCARTETSKMNCSICFFRKRLRPSKARGHPRRPPLLILSDVGIKHSH